MKTKRLFYFVGLLILTGVFVFLSCKKDDTDEDQVSTSAVQQTEQSESQDAVSDKVDQDIDNFMDKLEANNFKGSGLKASFDNCIDFSIDSVPSGWPKTVTLTFDCSDTINGEKLSQTGIITIVVELTGQSIAGKLLKKSITFINYKVKTDSASITINGTRYVKRMDVKTKIATDLKSVRFDVKDSIVANLAFSVQFANANVNFTRVVNRLRTAVLYFRRAIIWYSDIKSDTVTITGTVTGVNTRGLTYSRNISTPVEFTFCPIWPHNIIIAKGVIDFSNDGGKVGNITYSASGCRTKVTLNANGKTKEVERRLGLSYRKWW